MKPETKYIKTKGKFEQFATRRQPAVADDCAHSITGGRGHFGGSGRDRVGVNCSARVVGGLGGCSGPLVGPVPAPKTHLQCIWSGALTMAFYISRDL